MRLRSPLLIALTALLAAAAPAVAAAECTEADTAPTGDNATVVRTAVVCLTNRERAAADLPALTAEPRLQSAGQAYAQRMVDERFFSHVGPDGSPLTSRLAAYRGWRTLGENLAWGDANGATPRAIVAGWMASPGHRANILSPHYAEVGIGVAPGTPRSTARASATYVAEYGARHGRATPAAGTAAPSGTAPAGPASGRAPAGLASGRAPAGAAAGRAGDGGASPAASSPSRTARKGAGRRCTRGRARLAARRHGRRVARCGRVVAQARLARSSH